jgi:hypothetical protein
MRERESHQTTIKNETKIYYNIRQTNAKSMLGKVMQKHRQSSTLESQREPRTITNQ